MTQWGRDESDASTIEGRANDPQFGGSSDTVNMAQNAEIECVHALEDSGSESVKPACASDESDRVPVSSAGDETEKFPSSDREQALLTLDDPDRISVSLAEDSSPTPPKIVEEDQNKVSTPTNLLSATAGTSDEPDRVPSIVLELPQSNDPQASSEMVSTNSQGPFRPPKLQLQINAADTQSASRKSPVTVQEWIDSLPLHHRSEEEGGEDPSLEESDEHLDLGLGAEAGLLYNVLPAVNVVSPAEPHVSSGSVGKVAAHLAREPSVQSDVTSHTGSHCSSVESYLESRRPDPEEILLSLGFGGSVGGASGVDTEVSRIPRRFLQPSKVKGIAIDDFLRYQQDLIETFESGFCGYRGLSGSLHTPPSVIVAKIMEKLREHERENIPPGSVASAPVIGNTAAPSPPPPTASSKFSRAARRVLTRTTVLGALPAIARQQQQQQSVLTPDNRRFLDNQGSKSPEVPRKRMIIGHRSYTFSCDGDLIEVEPLPVASVPPKPKPLEHKDSVLSTATSLSFTSVDSDSDTDDHSSGFGVQHRRNVVHSHLPMSTPKSSEVVQRTYSVHPTVSKRMSSTSLSSWESESIMSPIHSSSDICFGGRMQSTDESGTEDQEDQGIKIAAKHYNRLYSAPDSPLSPSWPMRYESIDEDVEMKTDLPSSRSEPLLEQPDSGHVNGEDQKNTKSPEEQAEIQKQVISLLQLRRSSLKRQQHVLDDEDEEVPANDCSEDSLLTPQQETGMPFPEVDPEGKLGEECDLPDEDKQNADDMEVVNSDTNLGDMEDVNIGTNADEMEVVNSGTNADNMEVVKEQLKITEPQNVELLQVINDDKRGDSFEMEEICTYGEEEGRAAMLSRTRSDSSGFLDGDSEIYSRSNGHTNLESSHDVKSDNKDISVIVSDSPRSLHQELSCVDDWVGQCSAIAIGKSAINSQDSSSERTFLGDSEDEKELVRQRTMSLHNIDDKCVLLFGGVRRVKSAPTVWELGDDYVQGSSWSSVSNMFSFCSDESVIHVGLQKSRTSVDSRKNSCDSAGTSQYLKPSAIPCSRSLRRGSSDNSHSIKELNELVGELADRGWDITMGTDPSHFACHTDQQLLRLQGNSVRAGLAAYGRQLMGSQTDRVNGSHEVAIAEMRDRIAAELRHVADLLEEQPPHRAASITGQMAALLREQTRLCRQLEALSEETSPSILVEPAPCCSVLEAVREENRRLQGMVEKNSEELKEIRLLLKELVAVKNLQY